MNPKSYAWAAVSDFYLDMLWRLKNCRVIIIIIIIIISIVYRTLWTLAKQYLLCIRPNIGLCNICTWEK